MSLEELLILGLDGGSTSSSRSQPTHSLRRMIVHYPQYTAAIREIASVHSRWRDCKVAEGVLFVGQSGSGKSTVLEQYVDNFPRRFKVRKTVIPVLTVLTPEAPTVKSLAESFLTALGDPAASRGTSQTMTRRIVYFLSECEVELIMLDEFHHFFDGGRQAEGKRVTDWLKNLFNAAKVPVVLFGLPVAIQALNANQQLRRRFCAPHYISEFKFSTSDQQVAFRAVLDHIQASLPVSSSICFSEPAIASRFYFASCGLIDYVIKVIDEAVLRVERGEASSITLELLGATFRHRVWADVPDLLNPFLTTTTPRLLNQPREPFELWDAPERYTLSKRSAAIVGQGNRERGA